jgi:hypothetical protein
MCVKTCGCTGKDYSMMAGRSKPMQASSLNWSRNKKGRE